jgi:polyhydroxyalkanoate synthesis regulator phasin
MRHDRIVKQLDKMVARGELTDAEASQLRITEGTPAFEHAMAAVRARHAAERMAPAVAAGEMTQQEADAYLDRIRAGEHPAGLRSRLASHGPRRH